MNVIFFFVPFFLFAGIAVQAAGLYLFAILVPLGVYLAHGPKVHWLQLSYVKIGWYLLASYMVFPLSNVLNMVLAPPERIADVVPPDVRWSQFLQSHFGSALGVTAIVLIITGSLKNKVRPRSHHVDMGGALTMFHLGVLVASVLLLGYGLVQYFTGFALHEPGQHLDAAKLMDDVHYRVLGFFKHPLSLAGVSLAVFAFYWSLALRSTQRGMFLATSACHFLLVILSGGRFAAGVASLFVIVGLLTLDIIKLRWRVILAIFASIALAFVVYASGLVERLQLIFAGFSASDYDRLKFWQVHWTMFLDRPFIGQGEWWLGAYRRELYYDRLGFATLHDKYNAHNFFLETLTNVGIVGAITICFALLSSTLLLKRIATFAHTNVLLRCLGFALLANAINGLTQNVFFDSHVLYIYLLFFWVFLWSSLFANSGVAYYAGR